MLDLQSKLAPLDEPLLPNVSGRWVNGEACDLVCPPTPLTPTVPELSVAGAARTRIDGATGNSTASSSTLGVEGSTAQNRDAFSPSGRRLMPRSPTTESGASIGVGFSNDLKPQRKDIRKSTTGLLVDGTVRRRTRVVAETTDGWTRHLVVAAQSSNRIPNGLFTQFDIIQDGKTTRGFKYFSEGAKVRISDAIQCPLKPKRKTETSSDTTRSCKYVQVVTMNSWVDDLGWTLVGTGLLSVSIYSTATFIAANVGSIVPQLVHGLAFLFALNLLVQMITSMNAANRNWKASVLPEYGGGNSASGDLIVASDRPHGTDELPQKDEISMKQRAWIKLWLFVFQMCNVPRIIKDAPAQFHPWKGVGQFAALKVSGSRMHLIGHRSDFEFRALNREGQLVRLACGFISETVMAYLKIQILVYTQQMQLERIFFNILTIVIPFLINFHKIFVIYELIQDRNKFYKMLKGELGIQSHDPATKKVSLNLLWQFFGEKEPQQPVKKNTTDRKAIAVPEHSTTTEQETKKSRCRCCRRCHPNVGRRIQRACQVEKGFQVQPPKHPPTSSSLIARRMLVRVADLKKDLHVLEGFWELDDYPISQRLCEVNQLLLRKALPVYFEVTAMRNLESTPAGFPHSLGPLEVAPTENIKDHLKVTKDEVTGELRWTLKMDRFEGFERDKKTEAMDNRSGVLSPVHDVTFHWSHSSYDRAAACIPKQANCYAFSYPVADDRHLRGQKDDADLCFLTWGGWVYFDNKKDLNVVGINAFVSSTAGRGGIGFGPPKEWDPSWTEPFLQAGRFQPVTQPYLKDLQLPDGLKLVFCWLKPKEHLGSAIKCAHAHGGRTPGGHQSQPVTEEIRMGHHGGFAYMLAPDCEHHMIGDPECNHETIPMLQAEVKNKFLLQSRSFVPVDVAVYDAVDSPGAAPPAADLDLPAESDQDEATDVSKEALDATADTLGDARDLHATAASPLLQIEAAPQSVERSESFETSESGTLGHEDSDVMAVQRTNTQARPSREDGGNLLLSIFNIRKAVAKGKMTLTVRGDFGTCPLGKASALIVTEEGVGACFCYAYEDQRTANLYLNHTAWRLCSRILYSCGDPVTEEQYSYSSRPLALLRFRNLHLLSKRGPGWAHESISTVVERYLRINDNSSNLFRIAEGDGQV